MGVRGPCSGSATDSLGDNESASLFISETADRTVTRTAGKAPHGAGKGGRRSAAGCGGLGSARLPAPGPSPTGPLTLRAHQHHGHLAGVAEAAKPQEVVVHRLEADFILQAEHKHHRIHPGSKLGGPSRITSLAWSLANAAPLSPHAQRAGAGQGPHLELRGASFISDQQQVTLAIHHNLLLKPTP